MLMKYSINTASRMVEVVLSICDILKTLQNMKKLTENRCLINRVYWLADGKPVAVGYGIRKNACGITRIKKALMGPVPLANICYLSENREETGI